MTGVTPGARGVILREKGKDFFPPGENDHLKGKKQEKLTGGRRRELPGPPVYFIHPLHLILYT